MTLDEVVKYFGTYMNCAEKIGASRQSCTYWIKKGYIPIEAQLKIQKATNGYLKAKISDIYEMEEDNE